MKKKMKKKCIICNTIFEFKIKDLIPIKNEINMFIVNCSYCYSEKRVFYNSNPKPKKILNDVLSTEQNILSLNILQNCFEKKGLIKTSNLIKDFSNKYITSKKRLSRNEIISNINPIYYKQLEKDNSKKDLIDEILNKKIVKQLVKSTFKERNFNIITILFMLLPIIMIILLLI